MDIDEKVSQTQPLAAKKPAVQAQFSNAKNPNAPPEQPDLDRKISSALSHLPLNFRKAGRLALSILAVSLSCIGILIALAAFFTTNSVLSLAEETSGAQLDGIILAVADVQSGTSHAASALEAASPAASNVSSALRNYASFSSATADSLESLSASLGMLSALTGSSASFTDSAKKLHGASSSFSSAASGIDSSGASLAGVCASARTLSEDIGKIKENLIDAKGKIVQAISLLRIALLLFTLVLLALFSAVASSSLATLL